MLSESLVGVATQMLFKRRGGGRAAAIEILVGTPAVRNLIREGKTHQLPSTMQVGGKVGMQTMDAAIIDLIRKGTRRLQPKRALVGIRRVCASSWQSDLRKHSHERSARVQPRGRSPRTFRSCCTT